MPLTPALLAAIDSLAQVQEGHVARWQLIAVGATPSQVDHFPAVLGWTRVHRGVWRLPGFAVTPAGTLWAALLAGTTWVQREQADGLVEPGGWQEVHQRVRGRILVAGLSAAWSLDVVPNPPAIPQLLIPHDVRTRVPDIRVIRTRVWPDELTLVDGRPTTAAIRTLFDCARLVHRERDAVGRVRRMATRADGLRLCRAQDLHLHARAPREHGLPSTVPEAFRAAAFSLAPTHSHSATEHRGREIVTEVAASLGLHVEPRPFAVAGPDGEIAGEADIAIPLLRFDCEIDGPHHDEPDQKRRDQRRDAKMRRLAWTVRRYPHWLVRDDEDAFRAAVEADIRQVASAMGISLTG